MHTLRLPGFFIFLKLIWKNVSLGLVVLQDGVNIFMRFSSFETHKHRNKKKHFSLLLKANV